MSSTNLTGPDVPMVLVDDTVEHLCRLTDDPSWVELLLTTAPGTAPAAAVVGRFLGATTTRLDPGTPLAEWAGAGATDPAWRDRTPPEPTSIWSSWQLLVDLTGTTPAAGAAAYAQWKTLTDDLDQLLDPRP